jgi:uncharacterized protein (DUF885 family)
MKKILVQIATLLFIGLSFGFRTNANVRNMDNEFEGYKSRMILRLWQLDPLWAASLGYHKYDEVLVIPNDESRARTLRFCNDNLDSLSMFAEPRLTPANKIDYKLIREQLKYMIWTIQDLKAWQWDPSVYNVSGGFADMLSNNYASIDTRLHNFYVKMASVPEYYHAATENIVNPSKEHLQLAIEQNNGGTSVFEQDLEDAMKKSHLNPNQKSKMRARAREAIAAMHGFADWLKNLENSKPHSFRLGGALYAQKFGFEMQSSFTADEIYRKAMQRKTEIHDEMFILAKSLWPKYFHNAPMPKTPMETIRQMLARLSKIHVHRDSFQSAIEHQLPELNAFINKHKLLYIDPSKPLQVRKEPAYMAGVAGASISPTGPYDKNGKTYYNVGSLSGWTAEKAESYLREYNYYTLQILNIHEAIPGNYTQGIYANNATSMIKSILANNAMVEGWAVYGERMMLENGYGGEGGANATVSTPEYWLMYYKWHLRSVCNTILDYSVHTRNMSKSEAMNLLVNEAFQEKTEAENKWKRVSVTSVQLCCYFTGFTEIYDFRSKLMAKQGSRFDLKQFHERFLSYGSIPVKYIKELMSQNVD